MEAEIEAIQVAQGINEVDAKTIVLFVGVGCNRGACRRQLGFGDK